MLPRFNDACRAPVFADSLLARQSARVVSRRRNPRRDPKAYLSPAGLNLRAKAIPTHKQFSVSPRHRLEPLLRPRGLSPAIRFIPFSFGIVSGMVLVLPSTAKNIVTRTWHPCGQYVKTHFSQAAAPGLIPVSSRRDDRETSLESPKNQSSCQRTTGSGPALRLRPHQKLPMSYLRF